MRRLLPILTFMALALLGSSEARAQAAGACDRAQFRIVIDVGHSPSAPGATSARGIKEFEFNRNLAGVVKGALVRAGFVNTWVLLSSGNGRRADLLARTSQANSYNPNLFLSLHHDSVQPQYLQPWTVNGVQQLYSDRFSGYSIFTSMVNPFPDESVRFARLLGAELVRSGMHFSRHHAEPIRGEGRALIDPQVGVYRYNGLTVLARIRAPAALLESGLIVNREDELTLSSSETRSTIASAISAAIGSFCPMRP
jgi:N-acetylmuramoyl-L-alanine amidase